MVGKPHRENLCFRFQAAEGARVHDAIAVPRVFVPIGMRELWKTAAARRSGLHGPGRGCTGCVDGRDLPERLRAAEPQDFGGTVPRPRSASSAIAVFG